MGKKVKIIILAVVVTLLALQMVACKDTPAVEGEFYDSNSVTGSNPSGDNVNTQPDVKLPWENGGKQPEEYTWDEFMALSGPEQEAFVESFSSSSAFEAWESKAKSAADTTTTTTSQSSGYPWENGGKQPAEYTWDEFMALSGAEQEAFVESFGSSAEFEAWENNALSKTN